MTYQIKMWKHGLMHVSWLFHLCAWSSNDHVRQVYHLRITKHNACSRFYPEELSDTDIPTNPNFTKNQHAAVPQNKDKVFWFCYFLLKRKRGMRVATTNTTDQCFVAATPGDAHYFIKLNVYLFHFIHQWYVCSNWIVTMLLCQTYLYQWRYKLQKHLFV